MYLYKLISNVESDNWGTDINIGLNIMDKQFEEESASNYKKFFSIDSYICPFEKLFVVPVRDIFYFIKLNTIKICPVGIPLDEKLRVSMDTHENNIIRWKTNRYILSEPEKISLSIIKKLISQGANWRYHYDRIMDWAFYNKQFDVIKYMMCLGKFYHMDMLYTLEKICQTGNIELIKFFEFVSGSNDRIRKYGIIMSLVHRQYNILEHFINIDQPQKYISEPYVSQWIDGYQDCLHLAIKKACEIERIDIINYILSDSDDIIFESELVNIFKYGVCLGSIDIMFYAVAMGVNVKNLVNKSLSIACKNNHLIIVKILIGMGANIDANNYNALTASCRYGHVDIAKYLIDCGANVNDTQNHAIIAACSRNNLPLVKLLVNNGADVCALDNYPVRIAARNGYTELFKYLVQHGADFTVNDNYCIKQANNNHHYDIVCFIIEQ
nr:putative ankyrin repeat protein [Megavirus caiporensis]